jgi:hypothetical protein
VVEAIVERKAKKAEELISDHLMRTLATINIWQQNARITIHRPKSSLFQRTLRTRPAVADGFQRASLYQQIY